MLDAVSRFISLRLRERRLEQARRALDRGDAPGAEQVARALLARLPDDPEALLILAVCSLGRNDARAAQGLLARAADAAPAHPRIAYNLGLAHAALGEAQQAIAAFARAVELDPRHLPGWYNLGIARGDADEPALAVAALRRALTIAQEAPEKSAGTGTSLAGIRDALASALAGEANALSRDKLWSDAVERLAEALELRPSDPALHNERANMLTWLGRMDEALPHYKEVMRLAPDWPHSAVGLLGAVNYLDLPADAVFEAHRRVAREFVRPASLDRPRAPSGARRDGRLRIGYYSPDLRRHPVGQLFAPVIEQHDRSAFELYCYASHPSSDALTARIRGCADHWRDCHHLDDGQLAARIADDGLDLLVDLAGHTSGGRAALFAARPAPRQASWLGYFNTTGLDAMDWFITDPHSSPAGQERWFSERLWRLPDTRFVFVAPDYFPDPGPLPMRARGSITFGCCNHLGKITPRVLALWSRVLAAVPGSRLLLQTMALDDPRGREALVARAQAVGIAPERLELRPFLPPEQAARVYHEIDIALDPFPFAGGQTSLDALWMGVPLVTLPGELIASRQGYAFLANLDLARFAARDEADYVRIARETAGDAAALEALRAGLRGRMRASPLCDVPAFTRQLEAAWRGMIREDVHAPL